MLSTITTLGMFATLSIAAAVTPAPSPIPTAVANRMKLHLGTAHGGALDLPMPTIPPNPNNKAFIPGPEQFTVSVIVAHDTDITSIHVEGAGSPTPIGGAIAPGNIPNAEIRSFVVPREYAGNVAFNIAGL